MTISPLPRHLGVYEVQFQHGGTHSTHPSWYACLPMANGPPMLRCHLLLSVIKRIYCDPTSTDCLNASFDTAGT